MLVYTPKAGGRGRQKNFLEKSLKSKIILVKLLEKLTFRKKFEQK